MPGFAARPPMPPDATNVVAALAFSPDGKQLAAGGSDSQVHIFTAADGKLVRSMPGHTSAVTGLVFHPRGAAPAPSGSPSTRLDHRPA